MAESLRERKYRECDPRETVERIRGTLERLKLTPVESDWCCSEGCFYSLALSLQGTCIGANGKGVTSEQALASAYGELMERIQNMAVFRLQADMPMRAHRRGGFLYAPDEVVQGMWELLNSEDPWIRWMWDTVPDGTDRVSYLREWNRCEEREDRFTGLPYESLTGGVSRVLPVSMLFRLYLTNGMCAGNSREEALIHGLCECFERYANRMAARGEYPLKSIDRERIEGMPRTMVQALEKHGYSVTLYNASMGMGLPVAAALLVDRREGRYRARFGAAPDPALAMERALLELMQGQRIDRIQGMQPVCVKMRPGQETQRVMGILTHGIGAYPFGCFSEEPAGKLPDYGGATMGETLHRLVGLAQRQGWEVLYRDVSFLGVPAAHVVVPSVSEVEDFGDKESLYRYTGYREIKRKIRNLSDLDKGQARQLLQAIEAQPLPESAGVLKILHIDIAGTVSWYYRTLRLLKLSLALYCGDLGKAADLYDAQADEEGGRQSLYCRCARDVCLLRADTVDENTIMKSLERFYPAELVAQAVSETGPDLYRRLGTLPCFDCGRCPYRGQCSHPDTESLYVLLKLRMRQHHAPAAGPMTEGAASPRI